jgi:hypothetical protein
VGRSAHVAYLVAATTGCQFISNNSVALYFDLASGTASAEIVMRALPGKGRGGSAAIGSRPGRAGSTR